MKKVGLFSALVLAGFQVLAQQVTITGKVANPASDSVLVAFPENPFEASVNKNYAVLNDKGEFTLTFPVKQPVLADLTNGEDGITLFLQPGDNLDVKFNAGDVVKSIKFKGQGEAENTYLREHEKRFDNIEEYQALPENIYLREPGFVKVMDGRKEDELEFLAGFTAKSPVSEAFKKYAKAQIEFAWANDRLTYPDLREKIVFAEKRPVMTPAFYNFFNELDLNNSAAFISPLYNEYVKNYLEYLANEAKVKKTDQEYYQTLFDLAKTKLNGAALNLAQAHIIFESCKTGHVGFTERMLNEWNKSNTNQQFAAVLNQTYEANKRFALGAVAPDFKLTTIKGDTVQLSDLKGKLVYLSFWQTDCGLCLMDMPHGQELARKMDGKEIVFLQIGMDKDEKNWRNMVTKKQLLGTHAYGKQAGQDLGKLYELKETPAYFLIAEDGTFLNTKPKRPSSHGLAEEINQAFGKAAATASALKK